MTDKEMLDWVEKNVKRYHYLSNGEVAIDYVDESGGFVPRSCGSSLRDCIQKANPVKVLEGELYFLHRGIEMKAVPVSSSSCVGCDMWVHSCEFVNNSLEDAHSARCGTTHKIMFVHSKDKDEYKD